MTEAMPWTKPVRRFYCTLTAVLCAGWSLGLHAWSAGRAALRASGARLRGPLADLMLTPLGPGLLPRAAFLSRARRAVWTVFSLSPLIFAGVLALTAKPLRNLPDFEAAVSVILVAAALVWVEYLSLRAATALGIWAGYAVPAPGLSLFAGVLASSVFWVVRVLALIASSGLAAHCASHRGADMVIRVWFAVPACMLLATAVTVVALRAAGASMTAPLMLRFGAWAVRRGETMMGMGAACGRGRADLFPASKRPAAPAGGRLPGGMLWLIIGAIAGVTLVLFAFSSAIAADAHFVNWQSGTKARVIFVLAFALYGVTAALFIRHLRKSRSAAESKKGAAS
jgi:hypothetical protein